MLSRSQTSSSVSGFAESSVGAAGVADAGIPAGLCEGIETEASCENIQSLAVLFGPTPLCAWRADYADDRCRFREPTTNRNFELAIQQSIIGLALAFPLVAFISYVANRWLFAPTMDGNDACARNLR